MPFFSLSELDATNNAYENTGINLAKQARTFACGLYRNYTGWATKLNLPSVPPASFVKGVWDTVCANDPGGLPTPLPPPSGIRCWVFNGIDGHGRNVEIFRCGVKAEWRDYYNGDPNFVSPYIDGIHASSTSISVGARRGTESVSQVTSDLYTPGFFSEGSCEPCLGSSTPDPDPDPDPSPPPGDLTQDVDITYNDGTSVTIPFAWIDISPNLDINVDVGGVAFNFNVDGVHFNFNTNKDGDLINPPGGSDPNGGGGSPGGDTSNVLNLKLNNLLDLSADINADITITNDKIDDLTEKTEDCCDEDEPPASESYTLTTYAESASLVVDGLIGLTYVALKLTKIHNIKTHFGDNAPNVHFAGWIEFRVGGLNFGRKRVTFDNGIFEAPKNADGFAYTIVHGGRALATSYLKVDA